MPRILILVPFFGPLPPWIDIFLETCRWNPSIDWLLLTDTAAPPCHAPNVRTGPLTLSDFEARVASRLELPVSLPRPYKVCDYRLAFPVLFEDLARGYEFLGWSDLDVVYGNLRRYLQPPVLDHDVVSFTASHLSGHLTIVSNSARGRNLTSAIPGWRTAVANAEYQHLDEPAPDVFAGRFTVWARESYNTPLSPLIPWRDGRFVFPREWLWTAGILRNDMDADMEFPYLHFMHWKGGDWPRACGNAQWEQLERVVHMEPGRARGGFRVNAAGFFPLEPAIERGL